MATVDDPASAPMTMPVPMDGRWSKRLFVHERIGFGGRSVRIPKLRTLAVGTHLYADKTKAKTDLQLQGQLARWLRASQLDELPQLFIVPLGRLSLVGPRPRMMAEALDFAGEDFDAQRGVTTGLDRALAGRHRPQRASVRPPRRFRPLLHPLPDAPAPSGGTRWLSLRRTSDWPSSKCPTGRFDPDH